MSKYLTPICQKTLTDISFTLSRAIRSTIHHPTCDDPEVCPQNCSCGDKSQRLNDHTAVIWELSNIVKRASILHSEYYGAVIYTGRLLRDDSLDTLTTLIEYCQFVHRAFSYHHGVRAQKVAKIAGAAEVVITLLYRRVLDGRFAAGKLDTMQARLDEIRLTNLRIA